MNFKELRNNIKLKRRDRDLKEHEFQTIPEQRRTLEVQKARLARLGPQHTAEYEDVIKKEKDLQPKFNDAWSTLVGHNKKLQDMFESLLMYKDPQDAIEYLDDNTPFLLLPVRLETRFMKNPETDKIDELWLRIYPDDIHIETHEEILTEDEVAAAETYWTEVWKAGEKKELKIAAWRVLIRNFGSQRAAWIARNHEPNNKDQENKDLNPTPKFDPCEAKQESWSRAPRVTTFPDRFVAMGFNKGEDGYEKVFDKVGEGIPDPLIVGPNPSPSNNNREEFLDEDSDNNREGFLDEDSEEIKVDADMEWMVDFEEAVKIGMGMKIPLKPPLTDGNSRGFDRLIVLGLKLSSDESEGQRLVEELIEKTHYSEDGFGIVPQGTPTNNTKSGGAGYKSYVLGDDDSYRVEMGKSLLNSKYKVDGHYLAEALGIKHGVLKHIQYSDGTDQRDAHAMNTALWPATIGAFLEEMMSSVFSSQQIKRGRQFFIKHVSGRGPVPAIRVGPQPYGVLVTSSLNKWEEEKENEFEQKLHSILMQLDLEWDKMVNKVSCVGMEGDGHKILLDILGLHASSAEFHQRFAKSDKHFTKILGETLEKSGFNIPSDLYKNVKAQLEEACEVFLVDFDLEIEKYPNIFNKVFDNAHHTLAGDLIDDAPLSDTEQLRPIIEKEKEPIKEKETTTLKPSYIDGFFSTTKTETEPVKEKEKESTTLTAAEALEAAKLISDKGRGRITLNYIEWLMDSPFDTIRRQDFGSKDGVVIQAPKSLLYLMLRHALMNAYWSSYCNFYETAYPDRRLKTERKDYFTFDDSKFKFLYKKPSQSLLDRLNQKGIKDVFDDKKTYAEQIDYIIKRYTHNQTKELREVKRSLQFMKDLQTSSLARTFSEHIDLCSYRIDAWKLGLVNRRLDEQRKEKHKGIFLGAFGWLEDVHPKSKMKEFDEKAPAEFVKKDTSKLKVSEENGGYIHAPSLNHAVTSAILRNAYMSHSEDKMAVNLTSERVRSALAVIEGVQNGQELGALLGYQFERGLHDRYKEAELDKFILPLRKKFPLAGDHLNKAEESEKVAIEKIGSNNVVDGLALINTDKSVLSSELGKLMSMEDENAKLQKDMIMREVNRLGNIVDAVSDLFMAESVFQVAQGNYDRAGASMDALSKGDTITKPEILKTPRSGFVITHRLCIQIEKDINIDNFNVDLTPRAKAEPGINKWLAGMIGNPENVVCKAGRLNEESGIVEVSLKDLKLQPIDLLYIFDQDLEQNQSELDSRIAFAARQKLREDFNVRIDYTDRVDGKITLFELMPLLKSLKSLIVDSRALNAEDLYVPSEATINVKQAGESEKNPKGWNIGEIENRVESVFVSLKDLRDILNTNCFDLQENLKENAFKDIRSHLLSAASYGIQQSIPESTTTQTDSAATELIKQAKTVIVLIDKRLKQYDEIKNIISDDMSEDEIIEKWLEAGGELLGPSFKWLPSFKLKQSDEINQAYMDSNTILRHLERDVKIDFPVDEWLNGLARVRPKARSLETCVLLAENFPELTPIQLPYKQDDSWLGMEYPEKYDMDEDKLLLTTVYTSAFNADILQTGLLLDEWTEVIPTKNETTGIAFNYDAPSSEPPQTLILAVTPKKTGNWEWDDLVSILNETFDMAKKRAVEPQHIDETKYAHLLPGIMIPVTRYLVTIATNLLANMGDDDVKIV